MTILIDQPLWWFRGERWCHLVSDASIDELQSFADAAGIPRRGFQGDHYDVPERFRDALIDAGAVEVSSRELLRRLRSAGLRLTPAERRRVGAAIHGGDTGDVTTATARPPRPGATSPDR